MPLLHRKPFVKKKLDKNLKLNDKVFFCDLTEEIFTDYDEFWERLVLLNALVWTCELTGRPNLTYQEALESENKARKCISNVSLALKRPMMYIANQTRRGRIADMSDDVFNYIRDRYFVGEEVEAIVSKHWYDCKVTRVIMPSKQEIDIYQKEIAESDEEEDDEIQIINPLTNGSTLENDDDDICIIRDDHQPKRKDPLNSTLENVGEEYPPFPTVKYEVVEIEPWDYKECKKHVVSWDQIRRSKSAFTREKCKVFIKQCIRMNLEGYWTLKDAVFQKYGIKNMSYHDMFVGTPPKFAVTKLKKPLVQNMNEKNKEKQKKNKQMKEAKNKKKEEVIKTSFEKIEEPKKAKIFMSEAEKEELRKQQMEERERIREKHKEEIRLRLERVRAAKKKEKDLLKEEKRLMAVFKSYWNRKRDDLECDDHADLPSTTPIQCRIPNELFGDFVLILEFVNAFSERLELKDVYPHGINFDMLEHALVEKEVAGVFNDIIQLLLGAIFSLQEEEDEEVEGDTTVDMASMDFESNLESNSLKSAIALANKAATWSQQYQGVSLQKAPLDALTLTEILRLHLLASGASNVANGFWRHVNRGGYKPTDDPGLQFKLEEPEIIKKLTTESLFDLQIGEKLKVLNCLVEQILTYASVRDSLDEKFEKLRETNNNLRNFRFAEIRKDKEEVNAKKQKEKDEKMKQIKKKLLGNKGKEGENKEVNGEEVEEEEETEDEKKMREEREEKQKERRKQEALKKEKEFLEKIQTLSREFRTCPLGQDRAHRKYWLFSSLAGLFIEDWDPITGKCLKSPTPSAKIIYNPDEDKELLQRIHVQAIKNIDLIRKETEKNSSDKENDGGDSPSKKGVQSKKSLPMTNGDLDDDISCCSDYDIVDDTESLIISYVPKLESPKDNFQNHNSHIFGLCSADNNCPVHEDFKSRSKWTFIHNTETFENLINSLNIKGNRESELKETLVINKEKIEQSLQTCMAYKLDPSQEPQIITTQRKSERNTPSISSASSNLNFPPGTPIDKILELTLRDMILEVEEKLYQGMLGSLKVLERDVWRDAIVNGTSISFSSQDLDWGGKKRIKQFKSELGIEVEDESELVDNEDLMSKDGLTQAGVVKELAIAILQVSQALEYKYLKKPLAESDKMKKKRIKAENRMKNHLKKEKKDEEASSSEDEDESFEEKTQKKSTVTDNALRTPVERWEKSLMACTSFSQLFLHLATLDNSITWSRSAVNTRCSICRRKGDPENMLLCDECDRGYHMYCLKPQIKVVPVGNWYCDKCKPKEKPKSPRKQRKIYKEVESDEEEEDEEEAEEEESFVNHEYCFACETGGEIICCDTCPRSFHFECANLRKVPRGDWSCPLCKDGQQFPNNKKRTSKKKNSNKKEAKRRNTRKASEEEFGANYDAEEDDTSSSKRRGTKRSFEDVENDYYHKSGIENILEDLISNKDGELFSKPVYRHEVPDYYEKIKKPIDLRTIKKRFNKNKYSTDAEFIADILLIFQNCQQYYGEDDEEYQAGTRLSKFFLRKVKSYKLNNGNVIEDVGEKPSKRKR